ncbi:uroporphyrin-III C-methyltransferase [Cryobacterium sp. MP_3.1]|uniref:uroporphyrinogen-III C-methyltransferase n=1 Tax=Cryobacterium zongtaii TaxID=1259217 RepID=A0A2S3Z5M5_9MICO|nr:MULTISPECIES: uroporphyrinogen-III C-methyltransferase [Cryobacterium]MEC5183433.1 uroporphyrin-III C-methyltransferase [Cryobacterium sp. MP_3.1]POH59206.1 uroporphyrinogen-III C-methyltransferase [Cryobacterium zongtaii]
MSAGLDFSGKRVLVVGGAHAARRVLARYLASGATVYHLAGPGPHSPAVRPAPGVHTPVFPRSVGAWDALIAAVDLVAVVETTPPTDAVIAAACARHRTWLSRETAASTAPVGSVTLVGGGPGLESLLTVGALAALNAADIVYYDRLGPTDRLDVWAPGAEHIDVGKAPGHHAIPQRDAERMMVASALAGLTVVRLKGGDPFVFGRGGEEVIACRAAGVPVTVISGVTSAIAVPAAAGIPVTHREITRMFTVISGHAPINDTELTHLVGLGGTIVVLMGIGTLQQLVAGLTRLGMRTDMPVAIVERGFAHDQRTTLGRLDSIAALAAHAGVRSPAVVVIGDVVALAAHGDDTAADLLREAATLAT